MKTENKWQFERREKMWRHRLPSYGYMICCRNITAARRYFSITVSLDSLLLIVRYCYLANLHTRITTLISITVTLPANISALLFCLTLGF